MNIRSPWIQPEDEGISLPTVSKAMTFCILIIIYPNPNDWNHFTVAIDTYKGTLYGAFYPWGEGVGGGVGNNVL